MCWIPSAFRIHKSRILQFSCPGFLKLFHLSSGCEMVPLPKKCSNKFFFHHHPCTCKTLFCLSVLKSDFTTKGSFVYKDFLMCIFLQYQTLAILTLALRFKLKTVVSAFPNTALISTWAGRLFQWMTFSPDHRELPGEQTSLCFCDLSHKLCM